MQEQIRQRIKYLVEVGGVFPGAPERRLLYLLAFLLATDILISIVDLYAVLS